MGSTPLVETSAHLTPRARELDEGPVLAANVLELAEGVVFVLAPKPVPPRLGAIGVENTFVVTAEGIESVTRCPEHVVELST